MLVEPFNNLTTRKLRRQPSNKHQYHPGCKKKTLNSFLAFVLFVLCISKTVAVARHEKYSWFLICHWGIELGIG